MKNRSVVSSLVLGVFLVLLIVTSCNKGSRPTQPLQPTDKELPSTQDIHTKDVPLSLTNASKAVTRSLVITLRGNTFNVDPLIARKGDRFILAMKYGGAKPTSTFFIEGYNITIPFNTRGQAFVNFTADKIGTFDFGESTSNARGKLIIFE